ncbi:MAG: hypothetical protein IJL17_02100 [Kiritimatiellae bacterium]|nr:hypothetical protein [Kiritimatiellia bacterium]
MIRLRILAHSRGAFTGFEVSVNPSCILLIKEGRTDIVGRHYVDAIFCRELMDILPRSSSSYVAVEGTYEEVRQAVCGAKEGGAK